MICVLMCPFRDHHHQRVPQTGYMWLDYPQCWVASLCSFVGHLWMWSTDNFRPAAPGFRPYSPPPRSGPELSIKGQATWAPRAMTYGRMSQLLMGARHFENLDFCRPFL